MPLNLSKELSGLLDRIGKQVLSDIRENLKSKQVTQYGAVQNTGLLAESLKYNVAGTKIQIIVSGKAVDYWFTVEVGRQPGRFPPIEPIRRWVEQRRIGEPSKYPSTAFLIARKIAREGTEIWKQYGSKGQTTGIYQEPTTGAALDSIINEVAPKIREIIEKEIVTRFRLS